MRMKRGSRGAASERAAAEGKGRRSGGPGGPRKRGGEPSRVAFWFKRLFVWGAVAGLICAIMLAVAVGFAARSIPSYYQLRATTNAQTILVRARDGTEIVELGPSFGEWLESDDIPQSMKDAMVA